ncbi:MAG: hypothetical protein PGN08_04885, partial [Sphingomonas taxi]
MTIRQGCGVDRVVGGDADGVVGTGDRAAIRVGPSPAAACASQPRAPLAQHRAMNCSCAGISPTFDAT